MAGTCPACDSGELVMGPRIDDVPVHVGVLWPSEQEARECPRGDIHLAFCRNCGFVHNALFDEALVDYSLSYDNALHYSSVFQEYEQELASYLVDRYDLHNDLIVEIGCGPAHFLGLLCQLGDNRGLGFDPSHDPAHLDELAVGRVEVVTGYYDETSRDIEAALLCARHVLEHIAEPLDMLRGLRRTLDGADTALYFEVPNALLALEQLSVWDLMYEHCGYFTTGSLERIFARSGFEVLAVREAYEGQFVSVEARPGVVKDDAVDNSELAKVASLVEAFSEHLVLQKQAWDDRLSEYHDEGKKTVVWGAGGKAVSFMSFLSEPGLVDVLVDVNPRKHGMYLAGSGQQIVSPESLVDLGPDVVVVMNALYRDEITETLDSLGLTETEVVTAL